MKWKKLWTLSLELGMNLIFFTVLFPQQISVALWRFIPQSANDQRFCFIFWCWTCFLAVKISFFLFLLFISKEATTTTTKNPTNELSKLVHLMWNQERRRNEGKIWKSFSWTYGEFSFPLHIKKKKKNKNIEYFQTSKK